VLPRAKPRNFHRYFSRTRPDSEHSQRCAQGAISQVRAHERYAARIRYSVRSSEQIVQRLQHHHLEVEHPVIGLAAGVAIAMLRLRLRHGLDVSAEILLWHDLLDRLQRTPLALIASSLRSTSKKPFCPHDSLFLHPPITACGQRVRLAAAWREEFFEVP